MAVMAAVCPPRIASGARRSTSHKTACVSSLPVAILVPSFEKAPHSIGRV